MDEKTSILMKKKKIIFKKLATCGRLGLVSNLSPRFEKSQKTKNKKRTSKLDPFPFLSRASLELHKPLNTLNLIGLRKVWGA